MRKSSPRRAFCFKASNERRYCPQVADWLETGRQRGGQLKIRGGTVVEIDAGLATGGDPRSGAVIERVDFKVLVVGGLRVIRDIRRPGQSGPRQGEA